MGLCRRLGLVVLWLAFPAGGLHAVVISEIHHNPPVADRALEFVEVTNESETPHDLSGYAFVEGIRFVFPGGSVLEGGESVVVCADVDAVRARYGIDNALGNFDGRLDANGERLTLVNHAGVVISTLRYRDRGKWPVGPDGAGHTLVLRDLFLDPGEPENWAQSPELGGTPGRPNFAPDEGPMFEETVFIDAGEVWRYAKGTAPFSEPADAWRQPGFDDSGWLAGPSGFGFADDDDNTVLDDMSGNYSTVAVRKRFLLEAADLEAPGAFFLGLGYDDGVCAWLNGVEVARANCPAEPTWDGTATRSHENGDEQVFQLPTAELRVGENELALIGLNRSLGNNDFSLLPRLLHRRPPEQGAGPFRGVFNELHRGGRDGAWVEIYNPEPVAFDLTGLRVVDDPDGAAAHVFPDGSMIAPHGFVVLGEAETALRLSLPEVRLFLLAPDGHVLSAATFDRQLPAGFDGVEARFPDGRDTVWLSSVPTPGAPNEVARVTELVIHEILYHPPLDRAGEFIELYHRGESVLDVSGFRFDKGVTFTFPEGTLLAPGEFLVVADDPRLVERDHGIQGVLGPYTGRLADGGENVRLVDRLGNLVDEVRYDDGGEWPRWADGGGSSLELVDPYQDNDVAAAWRDSDESGKSAWEFFSFEVDYAPAGESELHLLLAERGVCRIDDVSIVRQGEDVNLIPNPGFETDTTPWVIEGTHVHSRRITDDSYSGDACLEMVATGKGDSTCNRLEIDTASRLLSGPYTVSLHARWQRGSNLLVLHGEFAPGPWPGTRDVNLSNNSLGGRLRLSVPRALGTPGAENSATRLLRETSGHDHLGPMISDVEHRPACPGDGEPTTVRARVSDPDGVAQVDVVYRLDQRDEEFRTLALLDDGGHDDGAAGDGVFGGLLPSFPLRSRVLFYVLARDGRDVTSVFPAGAPDETLVYMVEGEILDRVQLIMSSATEVELRTRRLHSNDLVPSTFVFDQKNVYYNVGVRYRGSPWGRPQLQSYRVRFPKDRPLHQVRGEVNISNRDRADGVHYVLIGRTGTPESPAPAADYEYLRTRVNGRPMGIPGVFEPVNGDFVDKWYGDEAGDGAVVLKAIGRLRFNDACQRTGWDEATLLHMDERSENYRFYWTHSVHQTRDRWEPFMELTRIMDRRHSADEEFDRRIGALLDVESFSKVLGARILMADWDAVFVGNGHNGYMLWDPTDGRWSLLPFDMGGAFGGTVNLLGVRDAQVRRLLTRPATQRVYFRTIHEILAGYWSVEAAGPWLDAMQRAFGIGASIKSRVGSVAQAAAGQLRRYTDLPLRILTNDGADFETEEARVVLEGEAPVQAATLILSAPGREFVTLEPEWVTQVRWRASVAVTHGENAMEIMGFTGAGGFVGATSITVHRGGVFVRGDVDGDSRVNIGDAVRVLLYLVGRTSLGCLDAADLDDSGALDLGDALRALNYLFREGPPPAAPFPDPGRDETPDKLGCG